MPLGRGTKVVEQIVSLGKKLLSESMQLHMAYNGVSIIRRINPLGNARESMELYTKPFEIELMKQNQRYKMQKQDSVY